MLIMLNMTPSWPSFWISLISAELLAMSRKETRRGRPLESLPSQEPASDLSWSNDFWAEVWAKATVAAKESKSGRAIRSDFMLAIPFEFVELRWAACSGFLSLEYSGVYCDADRI